MSQRTFTSSIYVKLGGQAAQNEDHTIQRVELDIDPVTKTIVREKKHSKAPQEQGNPPEFIIKPRRQFVNEGQSAKFKASYEGSPSTVLTWSKDGSVLHASRKNKIYKDEKEINILEVSNVIEEDGGIYTCTIRNSAGATETTAELEVYSKPRKFTTKKTYVAPSVDLPLQDKQVSPGDKRVVLECKFSNAIDAATCWYKDRQPLKKSLSARQIFDGWLSKLTLTTVTEDHNGLYECSASNNGGEVRTCCRVSVMAPGTRSIPPKFINPLSDQVLSAGGKLVLESKVTGYPRPSIRWYKNQQEIKSSRASKTEFDGSTVRLIIKNMEVSDTDSYKCIAENDVGIDQIKAKVTVQREVIKKSDPGIDIIRQSSVQPVPSLAEELPRKQPVNHTSPVRPQLLSDQLRTFKSSDPGTQPLSPTKENREPPIFLKELHDIDVTEGDPVELKIEVKGTPPIEIVWVHNNSEVNGDHPLYRTTCSDNIQQLVIPKCKMEDSGEFVCEAYNEYGEIDTFCRMNVNENKSDVKFKEIEPPMSQQMYNKVSSNVPHNKETPPDFVLKPHSSVVLEGNSAIFLCRPQGNPHPSVQWLKQGNVIENNQKYQITHGDDSILEIKDISEMDCGKYTCLLLNSAGSLSTEIELSILGTSPKNTSLSPESPIRKRSTPQSLKRGGINRKIERFEKPETSPPTLKSPTTNFTLNRTPNKYSSPSEGKMQNIRGQTRSQNKSEDFRDVLNRIKPSAEKSHENRSPGINRHRNSPLSQISPSGLVSRRQRDKSPVKVSEAIRKFSEVSKHQSDEDKIVNTGSHRKIQFGKISESPKRFQENERSRSNIRKVANELAESPKTSNKLEIDRTVSNITKIANEVVVSPKILNKLEWDDTDLVKTDLSVKERQAAIHGDLKTIIGKKQNMILQEELITGPQTQNVKTLSSPDSENKLKKNFLTEVSQPNSLEMEAVFGQKFEPSKISTTSEKPKKRASVIERSDSGPNEFQKMLQRKRNSLPSSQSPVKLQRPSSFRERSSAQKQNDMSPILRTNVRRVNNINEVLDGLKDKPPKGDVINKPTVSSGIVPKSSERQNRSRNTGETRRLSRESSPHFRNMLNQIEERGKNEQNDSVPNKRDEKISNSPARSSVNSTLSDRTKRPENSSVQDRVSLPQRTKIEFSPSSNKENSRKESSEFSDSSDNTEHRVVEDNLEKKRIQRVQKWDELSKLYSSPDSTVQSPSINLERKQNGWSDTKHQSNESYHKKSPYEGQLDDTSENYEQTENISSSANVKDSEKDAFNNEYQAVNGLSYENEFPESTGHAVMMNLKRTKLSEVEELFEDFSRIDREFESLKRNPKYGPLETLDVDDADKEILSKIPVLSSNFSEDSSSSPLEAPRSDIVKKTKYSKKFNFEKSPASVEQQDFRHVLKRHVEPHHRQHPKFLVDLADVKVSEGQPVTLECKVSGIPKPEVAWSMNNKRIKPSKFFRMPYEDNTAKLAIAGAYPEDDGEYVCSATNSLGTARCSCHLYVEECSNPSNEVTDEEGPSDMSSNQLSTFSSRSDSPLRKVSYSSTDTPTNIQTFDHHTNTVPRQLDQATPNMPSVSTSLDESFIDDNEFEDDFQNVKKEAPRIHEISPKNVVVERGQKLQLQMSFTAEPKPVIRWYRDSFEIISNKFYTINTTEHFSRLIIDQVDGGDGGKYNVVVENELGSDSVGTAVTVLDVPSQPSKPYATETTLFTIILSWEQPTFDGGSPVKKFKVEVCNAEEESWDTLTEECSSTSYCATNLAAHNPFFFRVSAKNKIGFSQPSLTSDVIVTKDNHPSHRLSVDSDEEELPFSPRTVVPVTEKTFEDHYENIEEVGKGKFGNVYKCFHKEDKKTWAAKVIKCRKKEERNNVKNEVSIMNELTHPKLLMLRDAYETPRSMVLVMEYIGGGELFDRVADEDLELTERDCVHFMRQICEGVRYMHEKSIMHLDLKPENILCVRKDSNLIKIIDFGLARRSTPGESLKVMFGTPEFIAPEVVNYDQIGLPTDIWSLGVICYVLLSGLSPFMGDNDSETLSNVTQGEFDFDDEAFDEISHDARSFIEKCLSKNMRKRLTVSQCIEHKWLIHSERNSSKKLRQSLRNLKQFMARRKWQKMGTAIRAIGRMSNWQKQRGDSKSHDHSSINSDSDIASQSDLSIQPSSRSPSHARTDSREDDHHTSDTTETDEEVFTNTKEKNCEDDRCENCENNNKHSKTITDSSAPAEIVKDMVDCEAVKGDIVRFDLVVEGTPTPNVKWFHGKKIIHEDHRHSFSCKNGLCSLIVRDICESDEGEYTCKVANDLGQDSCSAELIVYGVNAF